MRAATRAHPAWLWLPMGGRARVGLGLSPSPPCSPGCCLLLASAPWSPKYSLQYTGEAAPCSLGPRNWGKTPIRRQVPPSSPDKREGSVQFSQAWSPLLLGR